MSPFQLAICLGMVLSAAACAAPTDDAMRADAGWRMAHVDRVLPLDERLEVVGATQDCRLTAPNSAAGQAWLLVHYRRPPIMVFRVVPAMANRDYAAGEPVWINVSDCHAQPRVSGMSAKVGLV